MLWRVPLTKCCTWFFSKRKCLYVAPAISSVVYPRIYCSSAEKTAEKTEEIKEPLSRVIQTLQEKPEASKKKILVEDSVFSRRFKYAVFSSLGISVILIGTYLIYENQSMNDSGVPLWKQYLSNIRNQIEFLTVFIQEPSREKLLPDPVMYPYYQPPYTLVLEFTDVLAHPDWTYQTGWRFKKRPGLDYMLENLVGLYEIVVFTAEPGMTIFPVIEALDQKNLISYKLVRDSTHFIDGHHVKNLSKLNRDLKKVIVIDWNSNSVKFHSDNHLQIPRWKGEDSDTTLVDLTSFLSTIAQTEIDDVRDVLKFYKQFEDPLREFRNKQREYLSQQESQPPGEKPTNTIKRVFDYIL